MAGLILSPALANQNWGNLLLEAARKLAECSGVNDLLHDTTRLPGATPTAALLAEGFSQAEADLIVPSFAEVAAVWKFSTNAQTVAMTDFWFHARQLFGTNAMPK